MATAAGVASARAAGRLWPTQASSSAHADCEGVGWGEGGAQAATVFLGPLDGVVALLAGVVAVKVGLVALDADGAAWTVCAVVGVVVALLAVVAVGAAIGGVDPETGGETEALCPDAAELAPGEEAPHAARRTASAAGTTRALTRILR